MDSLPLPLQVLIDWALVLLGTILSFFGKKLKEE